MTRKEIITLLRCKAANAASLSCAFREEAESYERLAQRADPNARWSLRDPGEHDDDPKGLPEDWLDRADRKLPKNWQAILDGEVKS